MPAVLPIPRTTETITGLELSPFADRVLPQRSDGREIVRMERLHPSASVGLLECLPGVVEPALVGELCVALGVADPGELRHGMDQQAESLFALEESGLSALPLGQIVYCCYGADHFPVFIENWPRTEGADKLAV